jgi:Flp pilus assembly pilin Flp
VSGSARQWAIWHGARSEQGQTMAEYATLLAILIIAVVGALTVFSTAVSTTLSSEASTIVSGL